MNLNTKTDGSTKIIATTDEDRNSILNAAMRTEAAMTRIVLIEIEIETMIETEATTQKKSTPEEGIRVEGMKNEQVKEGVTGGKNFEMMNAKKEDMIEKMIAGMIEEKTGEMKEPKLGEKIEGNTEGMKGKTIEKTTEEMKEEMIEETIEEMIGETIEEMKEETIETMKEEMEDWTKDEMTEGMTIKLIGKMIEGILEGMKSKQKNEIKKISMKKKETGGEMTIGHQMTGLTQEVKENRASRKKWFELKKQKNLIFNELFYPMNIL